MGWSWHVGRIAGIPVYLHGTFLALIAFLFVSDWSRGRDLAAALGGVGFVLLIFGTVVLHELGHALTARRFGIQTRDITLLPIGGLARLERMPDVPRQELWVALAGPAVNVALALLTFLAGSALTTGEPEWTPRLETGSLVQRFMSINVLLAAFNMIPAFPMDGGRALRALLAERWDYVRATEIAAFLGQGLALVFGFVGLFANPFLVFIALFVWMGASAEASAVTIRSALAGIPVSRAMMTEFRALSADATLAEVAEIAIAGPQRDFPVLDGDRVVGILTRDALVKALASPGHGWRVSDAMTDTFETVGAGEMLERAFARLQSGRCPVLPVTSGGRLVGLLTADNVGEYVVLRGALDRSRGSDQQGGTGRIPA